WSWKRVVTLTAVLGGLGLMGCASDAEDSADADAPEETGTTAEQYKADCPQGWKAIAYCGSPVIGVSCVWTGCHRPGRKNRNMVKHCSYDGCIVCRDHGDWAKLEAWC